MAMAHRVFAAALLLSSSALPVYAQLGSAVGGAAANQSSLSGGIYLTAPAMLTNGQQAAFAIDPVTHGIVTVPAAGGGTQNVNITGINSAVPSLTNPIWIANAEAADVTGVFTNGTQTTSVTNSTADGYAGGLISINGTYATASGVFEASDDSGTTWYPVNCARSDGSASETGYTTLTNTNRQWSCPVGGNDSLRVRSTAVATGTVNVRVGVSAPPPSTDSVSGTVTAAGVYNSTLPTLTTGQTGPIQLDPSGNSRVLIVGAFASGTNLGSTQKIYPTSSSTSQTSPLAVGNYLFSGGANQNQVVDIVGAAAATTTGVGTSAVEEAGTAFSEITTATTTLVKSGATILHSVCVNTPIASATIKIYNAITATGTPFTLTIPSTITGESPFCMKYDVYFGTGITVVTSGATDVTVTFGR